MINRSLIRIKVVQMAYSYLLTSNETTIADALNQLNHSLGKAYELYNYLLQLMIEITELQDLKIDEAKNKYLPSEEDLNPNTRFIDNEFIARLRNDEAFCDYISEHKLTWKNDDVFMKLILFKVTHSEVYEEYMNAESTDFAKDCELWKQLMRQVILPDENLAEALESKSVYWNDDLDTMGTFVIKTIRRFQDGEQEPVLPMYKDAEDAEFGKKLFLLAVRSKEANDEEIDKFITDKWDVDRVAFMDRVIMNVCITEIKEFPLIPTSVSLNEYIEVAKYYSTPKSGNFINGVLNAMVRDMKAKRTIVKD
ncbi:MAG: transcription antitermination protein NusB [Muribaculaceae bacterium]